MFTFGVSRSAVSQIHVGNRYHVVGLCDGRAMMVYADQVEISAGTLSLLAPDGGTLFALAAGQWEYCYAASVIDGMPVAVETLEAMPDARRT